MSNKEPSSQVQHQKRTKDILLNRVERYLEDAESFIIPLKRIFNFLIHEWGKAVLSESDLILYLKEDSRFRVFEGTEKELFKSLSPLVSEKEMEDLGLYSGPRVILKRRIPMREEVVTFLLNKADQTFESLKTAWDIRPAGDVETEDRLLEALAKAQRLRRDLRTIFIPEKKESRE